MNKDEFFDKETHTTQWDHENNTYPLPYLKAIKIVLKFQRHLHVLKDFSVAFVVHALLILCFQNLILSADARKVTATSKMESVLVS